MDIEKLEVENIIEIKQIQEILSDSPELLTIFEIICKNANLSLNKECKVKHESSSSDEEDFQEEEIILESDSDSDEDLKDP